MNIHPNFVSISPSSSRLAARPSQSPAARARRMTMLAVGGLLATMVAGGTAAAAGASVPAAATSMASYRAVTGVPPADTSPAWPAVSGIIMGRGVPGLLAHGSTTFHVTSAGTVLPSITSPYTTFAVSGTTTYELVATTVDPGELPPGSPRTKPIVTWSWQVDQHVIGSSPVTVSAGERVRVEVQATAYRSSPWTMTDTLDIASAGSTVHVALSMFVGDVTTTVPVAGATVVQGGTLSLPVTAVSNAGPPTDVALTAIPSGATPGITVTAPPFAVAHLSSGSGSLTFATSTTTPPGTYHYDVVSSAFNGLEQSALGGFDLVVTAR